MNRVHPMSGDRETTVWPVRTGGSTGLVGSFGWTRDGGAKPHWGVDFIASIMEPVFAAHDGVIVRDGFQTNRNGDEVNKGYGSRIWLRKTKEVETRYAHLMSQVYKKNMDVEEGDIIGFVGVTGNAENPHLHFEVRVYEEDMDEYVVVDPIWWMTGRGKRMGIDRGVVEYR